MKNFRRCLILSICGLFLISMTVGCAKNINIESIKIEESNKVLQIKDVPQVEIKEKIEEPVVENIEEPEVINELIKKEIEIINDKNQIENLKEYNDTFRISKSQYNDYKKLLEENDLKVLYNYNDGFKNYDFGVVNNYYIYEDFKLLAINGVKFYTDKGAYVVDIDTDNFYDLTIYAKRLEDAVNTLLDDSVIFIQEPEIIGTNEDLENLDDEYIFEILVLSENAFEVYTQKEIDSEIVDKLGILNINILQ